MATKKKTLPTTKQYEVIEKFHGYINDKRFDHKPKEIIELTESEYKIYARFVKEAV